MNEMEIKIKEEIESETQQIKEVSIKHSEYIENKNNVIIRNKSSY